MTDAGDPRLDRLRAFHEALSAWEPGPGDAGSDQEWDVWMDRVGADADLAGLLHLAIYDLRISPAELKQYREASERFGSRLDPASMAEAYRLLAEQ